MGLRSGRLLGSRTRGPRPRASSAGSAGAAGCRLYPVFLSPLACLGTSRPLAPPTSSLPTLLASLFLLLPPCHLVSTQTSLHNLSDTLQLTKMLAKTAVLVAFVSLAVAQVSALGSTLECLVVPTFGGARCGAAVSVSCFVRNDWDHSACRGGCLARSGRAVKGWRHAASCEECGEGPRLGEQATASGATDNDHASRLVIEPDLTLTEISAYLFIFSLCPLA